MDISEDEKKWLFSIVKKAIMERFAGKPKFYPDTIPDKFQEKMGVFVTLKIKGDLRGCIGYPLPEDSIAQSVADNAVNAAFHDPRFPPLGKQEMKSLEMEITILSVPKPIEYKDPKELLSKIEIGRDGLILEYGMYAGLLLPQVPVEEKWDKETYLSYLCMKAGLPPDTWLKKQVRIKSFQGIVLEGGRWE